MAMSEPDAILIEAFQEYVEGAVEADDRYGAMSRCDGEGGSIVASRFEAGRSCWFEVAVHLDVPRLTVGFLTSDASMVREIEQAIEDSDGTIQGYVAEGFCEAGLDWPDPKVEQIGEAGAFTYFVTPVDLDELADLTLNEVRGKTVRMLEGYMIAFGPVIELAAEEE